MESDGANLRTDGQWNRAVKTALCRVGKDLGYSVWANRVDIKPNGGEYLYDVSWLKYEDNLLKSWPMVAESEAKNIGEIKDDFEKLLIARDAVRVMVFKGKWHKNGAEAIAGEICKWIRAYEGSQEGDTYLLIGSEEDKDNWWFRYFKNPCGQTRGTAHTHKVIVISLLSQ